MEADVYPKMGESPSRYSESYYNLLEANNSDNKKQISIALQDELLGVKAQADNKIMDEVLAFLKEGAPNKTIENYLTKPRSEGGLYDFYGLNRNLTKSLAPAKGTVYDDFVLKAIDDALGTTAQKSTITNGLDAFGSLLSKGYTRDEALAALEKIPLGDWAKFAERAPTPNIATRTMSYLTGRLINPTTIAIVQSPVAYLIGGGIALDVYQLNKLPWKDIGISITEWWQNLPFNKVAPITVTPTSQLPATTQTQIPPTQTLVPPTQTATQFAKVKTNDTVIIPPQPLMGNSAEYSKYYTTRGTGTNYQVILVDLSKAQIVIGLPSGGNGKIATANFLTDVCKECDIAINGDQWRFVTDPVTNETKLLTGGIIASDGNQWSQHDNESTLYIDQNNNISLTKPANGQIWNATSFS